MRRFSLALAALALLLGSLAVAGDASVHHALRVRRDPAGHRLEVTNRIAPGSGQA
jgi:hypothetical protein